MNSMMPEVGAEIDIYNSGQWSKVEVIANNLNDYGEIKWIGNGTKFLVDTSDEDLYFLEDYTLLETDLLNIPKSKFGKAKDQISHRPWRYPQPNFETPNTPTIGSVIQVLAEDGETLAEDEVVGFAHVYPCKDFDFDYIGFESGSFSLESDKTVHMFDPFMMSSDDN